MTIHGATLAEIRGDGDGMHVLYAFATWREGEPLRREVLPISSGGMRILPDQQAIITSRPQRMFTLVRLYVLPAIAEDFVINDITIGERSQFSQAGAIPADMFAAGAIDSYVSFDTAGPGMDIRMTVTYIGQNPDGEVFTGSMLGMSVGGAGRATPTLRTLIWLDDRDHVYRLSRPLHLRTMILERIDGEDLDAVLETAPITMIDPPRVITVHCATVGRGPKARSVLYAIDDSVDGVVFDVPIDWMDPPTFDLAGYRPRWLGGTAPRNRPTVQPLSDRDRRRRAKKRARDRAAG